MGNTSKFTSPDKISNCSFQYKITNFGPILKEIPINFCCRVYKVISFNTHKFIIMKVERIIYAKKFNKVNFNWNPTTSTVD
jgi:flavin reductase (DIM6/NTAB) family NADH-FMN oxidoreductase RutF